SCCGARSGWERNPASSFVSPERQGSKAIRNRTTTSNTQVRQWCCLKCMEIPPARIQCELCSPLSRTRRPPSTFQFHQPPAVSTIQMGRIQPTFAPQFVEGCLACPQTLQPASTQ